MALTHHLWYFFTMLLSSAVRGRVPDCALLESTPLWRMPLHQPPQVSWLSVGRHGRWAREDYRLPGLWCVHLYHWSGALRVEPADGTPSVTMPVHPGCISLVPPDTVLSHYFAEGGTGRLLTHLSAGFALSNRSGSEADITLLSSSSFAPLMQDSGDDFGRLNRFFEEAIAFYAIAPRRAEARLWEILYQLTEKQPLRTPLETTREPEAVAQARRLIELRLAEPLRVEQIAAAVHLSHNHLTRLFHAATGQTVVAYLRSRRMDRAQKLLCHTTLPIKNVATQAGLPDLHQFNKAVRDATGLSPRALRAAAKIKG